MPWIGFGLAVGTPTDIVNKFHATFVAALKSEEVRQRVAAYGALETSSIDELRRIIEVEQSTDRRLIESGRIKLENR